MKLTERIWMIASGSAGVGLTNTFDCNLYLINGDNGTYVLIDCGAGLETQRIKKNLTAAGFHPRDCEAILLTHGHADHSGGAAWLCEYTGAAVYALPETALYVSEGDLRGIALREAIGAGIYPENYQFVPCPVTPFKDGDVLSAGGLKFQAISTPGHCSGHCSWLVELDQKKYLFSGDLIFPGGTISLQPIWDCSPIAYARSIERLLEFDFDGLIPSHHGFLLERGKEPLEAARCYFQRMVMPPGVL
jgi:glyoxylase-like metal-dependent hydrolase (beta-lactamase superfamily II)